MSQRDVEHLQFRLQKQIAAQNETQARLDAAEAVVEAARGLAELAIYADDAPGITERVVTAQKKLRERIAAYDELARSGNA